MLCDLSSYIIFQYLLSSLCFQSYALDGAPYFIHFFLGAPPGEVSFFAHANSYIGSVYTFSSSLEESGRTASCHNCLQQRREGVLSTAQIPITNVILGYAKDPSRPGLHSLKPDEVESYLEKNLTWRAVIAIEVRETVLTHHPLSVVRVPPPPWLSRG
jgi:tyrosinase